MYILLKKRVGAEIRHYYYAPLNNTPFSIGLVLPHSYGNYWIKAGDEIRKSTQLGVYSNCNNLYTLNCFCFSLYSILQFYYRIL